MPGKRQAFLFLREKGGMRGKVLLSIICFYVGPGLAPVEVVYKAPIEGLSLDTQLHVQVVPDGYIILGDRDVTKLDDKHKIVWQFKLKRKGQHGISSFCYAGEGGLIIGCWEKSSRGPQARLIKLSDSGEVVWDMPVPKSEKVLAISVSPKNRSYYVLTIDGQPTIGSGRRLISFNEDGTRRAFPEVELAADYIEDVSMFIHGDSTVVVFGGTLNNTLEAESLGFEKSKASRKCVTIEKEAFYKKLRGFVNLIVLEKPSGGYYSAYTVMGSGQKFEDYRIVSFDDKFESLTTMDFGGDDSDGLSGMSMDSSGNMVLAGYSYSGVSRDKSEPAFEKNHCDVWVIKVDPKGNKVWDKTLTGPGCILQARVFSKGDQTWVVYGEENQVMIAALRD
jgi:hypothetical protein